MCKIGVVRTVSGDKVKLSCITHKGYGRYVKPVWRYHLGYVKWMTKGLGVSIRLLVILEV